jgi:hypothetical protein
MRKTYLLIYDITLWSHSRTLSLMRVAKPHWGLGTA